MRLEQEPRRTRVRLKRSNRIISATALVLASLAILGCASPQTIEVRPECTVPTQPSLPSVSGEALTALDDPTYWALETRERRLTDWALEMQAMLRVLCEGD